MLPCDEQTASHMNVVLVAPIACLTNLNTKQLHASLHFCKPLAKKEVRQVCEHQVTTLLMALSQP